VALGKIQLCIHRTESGKIAAVQALNSFAEEVEIDLRCIRQIFLERLITSLRVGQIAYIPFHQGSPLILDFTAVFRVNLTL